MSEYDDDLNCTFKFRKVKILSLMQNNIFISRINSKAFWPFCLFENNVKIWYGLLR